MVERIIRSNPLAPKIYETGEYAAPVALIERFRAAKTKIAIQKDGELTDISRKIYSEVFDIEIPASSSTNRCLVKVSEDGDNGFLYTRNKDICGLIANGSIDQAIIGIDRLLEDDIGAKVEIVSEFPEYGCWSIVLATPTARSIQSVGELRRIASKYPVLTSAFFGDEAVSGIEVIPVNGATEIYPYLEYKEGQVDAIVDLVVTGTSLNENGLVAWAPAIADVYPVLVKRKKEFAGSRGSGCDA